MPLGSVLAPIVSGAGVGVGVGFAVGVGVGVLVGVAVGVGVGLADGVAVDVGLVPEYAATSVAMSAVPQPVAWSYPETALKPVTRL